MRYLISPRADVVRLIFCGLFIAFGISAVLVADIDAQSSESRQLVRDGKKALRKGSYDEAERMLRESVEKDPSFVNKVELAFVLTKRRDLSEAYKLAFEAAKAEPNNARAFSVLGTVLLVSGRFEDARAILENSLRINNDDDLALAGLGMLEFYENRIPNSLAYLSKAIERNLREPDYRFFIAQVASRAEKYKQAADAYNEFLNISGENDSDRRDRIRGLIRFLRFLGEKEKLYVVSGQSSTKVRFDLIGERPMVEVRINEETEPLRFVIDTGSGVTVISKKTAAKLGVSPITKGGFARGIGGDGKFEIVYGFLRKIWIGDVEVKSVPVYIREFHGTGQNIDGYIGLAMISKFLTTIDYGKLTFSLDALDNTDPAIMERAKLALPLRLTSSGYLSGEVSVDGIEEPLNFIVDTGASISVISDRVATKGRMPEFAGEEKMTVIGAAGITEGVQTFTIPKVTFGRHSKTGVRAIALDLDVINEAAGFEQAGILGGNFLKNYRLTFDFKNSLVTFNDIDHAN